MYSVDKMGMPQQAMTADRLTLNNATQETQQEMMRMRMQEAAGAALAQGNRAQFEAIMQQLGAMGRTNAQRYTANANNPEVEPDYNPTTE